MLGNPLSARPVGPPLGPDPLISLQAGRAGRPKNIFRENIFVQNPQNIQKSEIPTPILIPGNSQFSRPVGPPLGRPGGLHKNLVNPVGGTQSGTDSLLMLAGHGIKISLTYLVESR